MRCHNYTPTSLLPWVKVLEWNVIRVKASEMVHSPPVVFQATRTMQDIHSVSLLLSVHSHKEPSLKGSEARGTASHSFSRPFVQSLTQLKLWCYFNCLCNSACLKPIDSLMSTVFSVCPQGCYSAVVDYFELYIYVAGALAIVVLTIEVQRFFIIVKSLHILLYLCLSSIVDVPFQKFSIKLKIFDIRVCVVLVEGSLCGKLSI